MNIPNILTGFRILLIPIFVAVFYAPLANRIQLSMAVFLLAGVTDLLDGYIARKTNQITRLGTLLDPLADKLMLITVLLCLAQQEYFPYWVAGIVIGKEAVMVGGSVYLYCSKTSTVIPANRFGKAATAGFYLAILLIAFGGGSLAGRIAIYEAVFLTLVALLQYRFVAVKEIKKGLSQK